MMIRRKSPNGSTLIEFLNIENDTIDNILKCLKCGSTSMIINFSSGEFLNDDSKKDVMFNDLEVKCNCGNVSLTTEESSGDEVDFTFISNKVQLAEHILEVHRNADLFKVIQDSFTAPKEAGIVLIADVGVASPPKFISIDPMK